MSLEVSNSIKFLWHNNSACFIRKACFSTLNYKIKVKTITTTAASVNDI